MSSIWRQSPSGRFTSENLLLSVIATGFWEVSEGGGSALTQNLADTISFSDITGLELGKMNNDTLTLTDSLIKGVEKTNNDTISLSDSKLLQLGKFMSDILTLSDAISIERGIIINLADSLSLSDNVSLKEIGKALTDILTLTDIISKESNLSKNDSLSLTDSVFKDITKTLSDQITLSDTILKNISLSLSDGISLVDAILIEKVLLLQLADSITFSDTVSGKQIGKGLNDTINLLDNIVKEIKIIKEDSISFTDLVSKEPHKELGDFITYSDIISKEAGIKITDVLQLLDNFSFSLSAVIFNIVLKIIKNFPVTEFRMISSIKKDLILATPIPYLIRSKINKDLIFKINITKNLIIKTYKK